MKYLQQAPTPRRLQVFFIAAIAVIALARVLGAILQAIVPFGYARTGTAGYMSDPVGNFVYPILLFVVAYILIERKVPRIQKIFESTVVVVVGATALRFMPILFALPVLLLGGSTAWLESLGLATYHFIQSAVPLAAITAYLLYMRRKKQW